MEIGAIGENDQAGLFPLDGVHQLPELDVDAGQMVRHLHQAYDAQAPGIDQAIDSRLLHPRTRAPEPVSGGPVFP